MHVTWSRPLVAALGTALIVLAPVVASGGLVPSTGGAALPRVDPPPTAGGAAGPADTDSPAVSDGPAVSDDTTADATTPLRGADAADPFVVVDDGQARLFTTNNAAGNVPVATGTGADGADGVEVSDALPVLPAWAAPGFTWAPAVTSTDGGWVLAFTARHQASGRQCIGVATSTTIDGPYTPHAEPLVCEVYRGGSIDPSFVAGVDGERWLLYKDDGNCCGLPTTIYAVPLTAGGTAIAGPPADLLVADQPWEDGLVEAPTMRAVGDRWLLLYSGNRWDTAGYAVGAAWCDSPVGPCEKHPEPVLAAGGGVDGPGGVEFVSSVAADGLAVTFHAWPVGAVGYGDGSTRRLHVGRVEIAGDEVSITARRPAGHR